MELDRFSYHLGAADCFCEMVRAGVKRLALSHPCESREERDAFLPEFDKLALRYGVKVYPEDSPFLTDLFPISLNRGKYNALFYAEDGALKEYLALKAEKCAAIRAGTYEKVRTDLARRYGALLSYTPVGIDRLLSQNTEKAPVAIQLFGASGSGTTTLGRLLAEKLGYFYIDTDDCFWLPTDPPYTTPREMPERLDRLLNDLFSHAGVVISGTLGGWARPVMPFLTLAVRLELEDEVRLKRLEAREFARFEARIRPGGDMAAQHREFMEWAARYDSAGPEEGRSRSLHDALEKELPCPVLHLHSGAEPEENLNRILTALNGNFSE